MSRQPESAVAPRQWLGEQARTVRGLLAAATAAGLVQGLALIVQAALMAHLVHSAVAGGVSGQLLPAAIALAGSVALRVVAHAIQQWAGVEAGLHVRRRVRRALVDHMERLGPHRLGDVHTAGLASRLVEQVDALDGYYARFLPQMVLAALVPLAILAVVVTLDWLAALLLLFSAPLIPAFMALVGMGAEQLNRSQFEALTRLSGHFLDRVRGLTTLRLFGYAGESVADVRHAAEDYRRRSMRTLRVAFLSSAVLEFFSSVAIAMVAMYIGFGLLGYIEFGPAGELTLFSGLFILLLAPEFFQPLRSLSQHYHDRAAALGAASELAETFARSVPAGGTDVEAALPPGGLRLAGVQLAYAGRGSVLDGLDLTVSAGESVVLWGASGSGKTTLLRLMAGFLTPDAGTVARGPGGFAWMGQRPFIIAGTLAENIRLGNPEAEPSSLERAARQAGVLAFAEQLPDGLETRVGEGGYGISGGQAQRLALARVLVAPRPLVLLDEPTAALDSESERHVLQGLGELAAEGRTLVIASHHAAVRQLADRVVELEGRHNGGDAVG